MKNHREQLTNYEKFETDIALAIANAKEGNISTGQRHLHRAIRRCEDNLKLGEYTLARREYTKVYRKYFV